MTWEQPFFKDIKVLFCKETRDQNSIKWIFPEFTTSLPCMKLCWKAHIHRCRKTYIYYCSQTFDSTNRMLKQQSIILIYSLSKMILFKFLRKWHVSYVYKIGFPCLRVWCQKLGQCFTSIFMIIQKILHKWTHQYFTKKWILTIHSWKSHCHT